MKIVAISDLHGQLPKIPKCDLLLIAGDICPVINHDLNFQACWLDTNFRWWLKKIPAEKVVAIAGNHDRIFEESPQKVPSLPWIYLQDTQTEFKELKIWGSPWQPVFYWWAFNLYEKDLKEKWKLIPNNTDVLILHGPPYKYGDKALKGNNFENTGSPSLLEKIKEIKPKLVVFGHIHEGRGQWKLNNTILANVTILNEKYEKTYKPMIFEL